MMIPDYSRSPILQKLQRMWLAGMTPEEARKAVGGSGLAMLSYYWTLWDMQTARMAEIATHGTNSSQGH